MSSAELFPGAGQPPMGPPQRATGASALETVHAGPGMQQRSTLGQYSVSAGGKKKQMSGANSTVLCEGAPEVAALDIDNFGSSVDGAGGCHANSPVSGPTGSAAKRPPSQAARKFRMVGDAVKAFPQESYALRPGAQGARRGETAEEKKRRESIANRPKGMLCEDTAQNTERRPCKHRLTV